MLLLEAQRDPSPHSRARKQIIEFISEKVIALRSTGTRHVCTYWEPAQGLLAQHAWATACLHCLSVQPSSLQIEGLALPQCQQAGQ